MKRIAYLCLQVTREGQASHAHVHEMIRGLERRGRDVTLFEPTFDPATAGHRKRLRGFLAVERRLWRERKSFDLLYCRAHFAAFPVVWALRGRVPIVQEINGPYADAFIAWPRLRFARGLIEYITRAQLRWADAVIAVTDGLAAWVREETGRDAVVIPNGADADRFTSDAPPRHGLPERYAVFFGALARWQGLDDCLRAVSAAAWPGGVRLVIAGAGAEAETVEAAAREDERVVYLGRLPYGEVPSLIAGALCGLIPMNGLGGREETGLSPLKLYETMACGVPAVVTDWPGQSDLVRSADCGLVVPAGDPGALAAAVAALAADPDAAAAMGGRGRAAVLAGHTWDARAASTEAVLAAALGEAAHG